MEQIVTWLSGILRDKTKREKLFSHRDSDAQSLIDALNYFIADPSFRNMAEPWLLKHTVIALRKLCETSMLYPTCYVLEDIQDISSKGGGGFCDIHQGRYSNQLLCLKVARLYQDSDIQRLLKAHAREAILWSQLDHSNIVPFYGIFYWDRLERICLVSPWMENGDIVEYLERVPDAPRKPFVYDIANGLQYLHDQNIVHGDLKGRNVLIDDYQNARLADFGLSTVVTDETLGFTRTTSGVPGRTTRWASPELLDDDARPAFQSDLWAFGCVCYEVLTGLQPFTGCSDIRVLYKLIRGELPADLDNTRLDPDNDLNKKLCDLVRRCWSIEATHRPACQAILRLLEGVITVQRSHGPHLESFTPRNSLIHSQTSLTDPARIQVKQAGDLLARIYNKNEESLYRRTQSASDAQDRLFVLPYTPRPPGVLAVDASVPPHASAVVDIPASHSKDTRCPASITELAQQAQEIELDLTQELKKCLRETEKWWKKGRDYLEKGDLEQAFMLYARSATMVLDALPLHPQYRTGLSEQQRRNLSLHSQEILDKMGEIKPILLRRFDEWQAAHPNEPPMPLDRLDQGASVEADRNWIRRESAKVEETAQTRRQHEDTQRRADEPSWLQRPSSSRNQLDQQKDNTLSSVAHASTVVDASLSDNTRRPASIAELALQAQEIKLDLTQDLKKCLRQTETCRKKGKDCLEKGDLEQAFMLLSRSATMILEALPLHPQYVTRLNAQQRQNLSLNGQELLDKMDEIKPVLVHRFIKWQIAHPDDPLTPPDPIDYAAPGNEMLRWPNQYLQ